MQQHANGELMDDEDDDDQAEEQMMGEGEDEEDMLEIDGEQLQQLLMRHQ